MFPSSSENILMNVLCWATICHQAVAVGAVTLSRVQHHLVCFPYPLYGARSVGFTGQQDTCLILYALSLCLPLAISSSSAWFCGQVKQGSTATHQCLVSLQAVRCTAVDSTLPTAMPLCKGKPGAALRVLAKSG